jgi:hypothetical protein
MQTLAVSILCYIHTLYHFIYYYKEKTETSTSLRICLSLDLTADKRKVVPTEWLLGIFIDVEPSLFKWLHPLDKIVV